MTSNSSSSNSNSFDLTSQISPYLDRHLVFPLLEFIDTLIDENKIAYNKKDIAAARLALLRPTHMVDYAMDVQNSLNSAAAGAASSSSSPPAEMEEQKKAVYKQLEDLRQGCAPLMDLCQDEEQRVSFEHVNFVGCVMLCVFGCICMHAWIAVCMCLFHL